jgi:hypothetical protein
LGPLFLRTSSYAHVCPRREQVLQLGFIPSHFNFLFLQIMHANRFGFGTIELPFPGAPVVGLVSVASFSGASDTIIVSGGVADEDDMSIVEGTFVPVRLR